MDDHKILSLDEILDADDRKTEMVDVPEWGGSVKVRALSRRQVVDALQKCTNQRNGDVDGVKLQMLLLVRGLVEPQVSETDLERLEGKHAEPINRIVDRVKEISGMGADADEAADNRFPDGA